MKFNSGRWARAFLYAASDDYEAGLMVLKSFAESVKQKGRFTGKIGAKRALVLLDKALKKTNIAMSPGVEAARATLYLVILRSYGAYINELATEVKRAASADIGIITASLEAASRPDDDLLKKATDFVLATTGMREVCFDVKYDSSLIAGCRVIINDCRYDFSLRGRIEQLEAWLKK